VFGLMALSILRLSNLTLLGEVVEAIMSGGVFKGPVRELRRRSGDSKVISSPSLSFWISGSIVLF
jgi:hypothetical protein